MDETTIIENNRASHVEVSHRDSDPGTWIVKRWKKSLWFRRQVSTDWFSDKLQALAFANEMKRGHDKPS
jgi:hypothetical protein